MSEKIDLSGTVEAKSDQLNAMDLTGTKRIVITSVKVTSAEQPISIHFEGDNGKPWKPCLGQRRILIDNNRGWGDDGRKYVGRTVDIYNEATVIWAGKPYGGIRICGMSDIKADFKAIVSLSGKVRIEQPIYRINIVPLKQITDAELKAFTIEFDGAKTDADLKKVGAKIAGAGYDDEGTAKLKALYRDASKKLRETK